LGIFWVLYFQGREITRVVAPSPGNLNTQLAGLCIVEICEGNFVIVFIVQTPVVSG